ncbi:biosynthetic arginine decarboxylase [Aquicella lusitana]|uniref:Biosynthetic arginine decarboxylase n=1 Tax=Aquicella lusitana TaxID=254246 RepID=A0A370GE03_9COXI|nr:biosynthetic arginine decarboxylase [Aquicella lusitana]RDI41329.1 arginine decarboxylase [Aquicella lusitana]VVC72305.1 Biosynthetic arginine decarboxylase [Aquicella lusitana]
MTNWSIQQARDTYHIAQWSDGFFDVCERGNLQAYPDGRQSHARIDLIDLAQSIKDAGISFPVLVRFTDILRKRIQTLNDAFARAIQANHYQGAYISAYPVKVNQQRHVVESILDNKKVPVGLETGSKPELLAALALSSHTSAAIICNGYKDREYIRLALIGQRIGHRIFIILEKLSEVPLVLEEAEKLNIEPIVGVRVRLSSVAHGKWQNSGGEKSKFGFSAPQLLQVVNILRQKNKLHWLQVLHFHFGSQVANIAHIQRAMHEAARYYVGLRSLGAPINTIDVGGGLGVDYEGTKSRSYCSMNYSIQEYANNIVDTLAEICEQHDLPHPGIITESGRAITAHHAMLITNVISTETACDITNLQAPGEEDMPILHNLWNSFAYLSESTVLEIYHDICHWISEVQTMYIHGLIDLEKRAYAEQIYYAICFKLRDFLKPKIRAHREVIDELNEKLANKFVCNFSLFQSLPDAWAIDQVFPIMPLSGLEEPPLLHGILHDITCDSDGCIKKYVNNYGLETTLPMHPYDPEKPYLLGIFLVGAYQEILGDLHNLFGDTHSVHVELTPDGKYRLTHAIHGDTVASTLRYVDFNANDLVNSYQKQLENAQLTPTECETFLLDLKTGLTGYTYFED